MSKAVWSDVGQMHLLSSTTATKNSLFIWPQKLVKKWGDQNQYTACKTGTKLLGVPYTITTVGLNTHRFMLDTVNHCTHPPKRSKVY